VLAHYPGINVAIPSTPEDAAGLMWTAMHCEDPTFVLVPKHLLWAEHESTESVRAVPLGVARKRRGGSDVTLVAWGNTIEKSLEALAEIGDEISVDLLDLRSIVPWDRAAIEESVARTGRLVVVQEDSENCSVGQMIVAHLAGLPEIWSELLAPPIVVSKPNVMIGYNPIYEYAALPDVKRIVAALRRAMSSAQTPRVVAGINDPGRVEKSETPAKKRETGISDPGYSRKGMGTQKIVVPIMGEGIRNAKVVTLLKKPGEQIALDDPLCEVETDKAVYPIESSFAGTMGEWKTEVGATVDIGEEIGTITTSEATGEPSVERNGDSEVGAAGVSAAPSLDQPTRMPRQKKPDAIEPALSPTIVRRLRRVVAANLQIDARWEAIRAARAKAKKKEGKNAASPSVMVAWAVVRAMEK